MAGAVSDPAVFSLAGGAEAACAARRAVRALDGAIPASVRDDLLLLLTELVTNAVRHGGVGPDRPLNVTLERRSRCVRVEVVDPGAGFVPGPARATDGTGGWGLFLVDQIAERWGVSPASPGTCVWCELRLAG
jgi:anti-sigma regulatory factor (Ser/Thr protein kinase)